MQCIYYDVSQPQILFTGVYQDVAFIIYQQLKNNGGHYTDKLIVSVISNDRARNVKNANVKAIVV